MAAIDFEQAFKVLQLSPGATLQMVKENYISLIADERQFDLNDETKNESDHKIMEAYNHLQLLLKPYNELDTTEQQQLLESLNEMPQGKLQYILDLYPHQNSSFYWHSKNYPRLTQHLYGMMTTSVVSSLHAALTIFTSCSPRPITGYEEEEQSIELPLWVKKNQ